MENANWNALKTLLSRVYLQGLIEQCSLHVRNGIGHVQAVDMSNALFLSCTSKLGKVDNISIGLSNLAILCKFLEAEGEVSFAIKEKWLISKRKGHGQLKLLLADEKEISTNVVGEDACVKLLKAVDTNITLTEKVQKNITYYLGLLACQDVVISGKEGMAYAHNDPASAQQFKVMLGEYEHKKDFSVCLYSKYFSAVLSVLDWSDDKNTPSISLSSTGGPVIIKQGSSNIWALSPVG